MNMNDDHQMMVTWDWRWTIMYNASMLNLLSVGIIVSVLIQNTDPHDHPGCSLTEVAVSPPDHIALKLLLSTL